MLIKKVAWMEQSIPDSDYNLYTLSEGFILELGMGVLGLCNDECNEMYFTHYFLDNQDVSERANCFVAH